MKKIVSLIFVLPIVLFTSCEKNEEYKANVSVINDAGSPVTNFNFEGEGIRYSKTIETLAPANMESFKVTWIGKSSGLLWKEDNPNISVNITYTIGSKSFDIRNEEGVQMDRYNYYSTKEITDDSSVEITITDEGYRIEFIE